MPRYANREMLTPSPSGRGGCRPVSGGGGREEWEGQIYTVRFDDGSGRVLRLRARRATPEELREADDRVNQGHAEDLQALADI